jgi:hypothetical protein
LGATGSGHGPVMGFCKSCNKPFVCKKNKEFLELLTINFSSNETPVLVAWRGLFKRGNHNGRLQPTSSAASRFLIQLNVSAFLFKF